MGWIWPGVLAGDLDRRSNGFDRSVAVVGVVTMLSPLCFRAAEIDSWLAPR
jgi:hypothetical protein